MTENPALGRLLAKVFDDARSDLREQLSTEGRTEDYERFRRDFIFHMTDWLDDLRHLGAMDQAPDVWETEKATDFLMGFLYHVIPHLNAAGRLLLDEVPDAFADDQTAQLLAKLSGHEPVGR